MGTRAYAESVAQLIDPDGHFFKERILSRDESGSKVCHDWVIFYNLF
jgi:RNA polymerase II subunit A-like phosphatase